MADYISYDDLINYAIPLQAIAQFSATQVTTAIQAACSEADTYLSAFYDTPLTTFPPALKMHVARAAAYHLYSAVGFDPDSADMLLVKNYERALDFYKSLQKNLQSLPAAATSPAKGNAAVVVSSGPRHRW